MSWHFGKSMDCNALQLVNTRLPRDPHNGILTDVNDIQPSNTLTLIVVQFGKLIFVNAEHL